MKGAPIEEILPLAPVIERSGVREGHNIEDITD